MIVCSICKKFVKKIEYMINGLEDIKDVTGICKRHWRVKAEWDDYDEIVSPHTPKAMTAVKRVRQEVLPL